MNRITPLPYRPVGAPGLTRWLGGTDAHPTSGNPDGIDETTATFTAAEMVNLYPGGTVAKGAIVCIEVIVPADAGDDILWLCFGDYDQARAWPIFAGERFEHNAHLQGVESVSLRATAADLTPPAAAIKPRIKAEWDRRGAAEGS